MTKIESETVSIPAKLSDVQSYLSDFSNYQVLFPEDRVEGWKSNKDSGRFKIKSLAEIGMKISERNADNIIILSDGDNPFEFVFKIDLNEEGENTTGKAIFEAKMNPMLAMMAKTPLTNLFNSLAKKLQRQF